MTARSAQAGVRGEHGRSDCWVEVEARAEGGLELSVTTKVEAMYGDAVRATCARGLAALGVQHARP